MFVEAGLGNVHKAVGGAACRLAGSAGVGAPLGQAGHLARQFQLFASLGFNQPDRTVVALDDEIRRVGAQVTVALDVVELDADGQVVFGKGGHAVGAVQKTGKTQRQPASPPARRRAALPRCG